MLCCTHTYIHGLYVHIQACVACMDTSMCCLYEYIHVLYVCIVQQQYILHVRTYVRMCFIYFTTIILYTHINILVCIYVYTQFMDSCYVVLCFYCLKYVCIHQKNLSHFFIFLRHFTIQYPSILCYIVLSHTILPYSRYTIVYYVVLQLPWYSMLYYGILWYTMVDYGRLWYPMVSHGLAQYGTSQHVLYGIPWQTMLYLVILCYSYHGIASIVWYTMVYYDIAAMIQIVTLSYYSDINSY